MSDCCLFDHRSLEIRLIDHENVRTRRATPDKSVVTTEQKDEPAKDQPSAQPQQQPQQQQQQASQLTTSNTTNASHDVKYFPAYSTSEATVQVKPTDAISNATVQASKDADVTSVPKPDYKKKAASPVKVDDTVRAMIDL